MRARGHFQIIALLVFSIALSGCFSSSGKRSRKNSKHSTSAALAPEVRYTRPNLSRAIIAASKTLLNRMAEYDTEVQAGSLSKNDYESMIRRFLTDPAHAANLRQAMLNEHRTYLELGGEKPGSTVDFDGPAKLGTLLISDNRDYREIVTAKYCADWDSSGGLRNVECVAFRNRPAAIEQHGAGVLSMQAFIATHKNSAGFNFRLVRESFEKFACGTFPDSDDTGMASADLADDPIQWGGRSVPRNGKTENCFMCHKSINPRAVSFYNFNREGYFVDSIEGVNRRDSNLPSMPIDLLKSGVVPSVMGVPTRNLSELGQSFARDPRFASCMTRRYFNFLLGRPYGTSMPEEMGYLVAQFENSNFKVKDLLFYIMTSPAFINRGEE